MERRWARRGVKALAALAVLALVVYAVLWVLVIRELPSVEGLRAYEPPLPTNVRAIDGTPVYSFARERRVQLSYDEFPPRLVQAFLSAEDKDFFHHHGIDPSSFLYAVFDYVRKSGSGERARGGSTITQQVAKNLLVGNEYSPTRKIREAVLALRIKDPGRHRPFRTPLVWVVAPLAIIGTLGLYLNLPFDAKMVLPIWGAIGLVVYFIYGYSRRRIPRGALGVHCQDHEYQ